MITITDVEEVIARMGKPEDMEAENDSEPSVGNATRTTIHRRLYRNPDDKLLGGVISGMAAYLGWDVTLLRLLLLVVLICGVGTLIPVYIVCWLVIPEARTAAEKLSMRGEAVTVENIGKTVTDGFEKVANGVNDYMKSDKPRTFLQKLGDALVMVAGWFQNLPGDICHYLQPAIVCVRSSICRAAFCGRNGGYWWRSCAYLDVPHF